MKASDAVNLLADAVYNEIIALSNTGMSDDAAMATLAVKIEEMQSNLGIMIKDRITTGVTGRAKNPIKILLFLKKVDKVSKQFVNDYKRWLDLAGDIAVDDKFKPKNTSITFEQAFNEILNTVFEENGI